MMLSFVVTLAYYLTVTIAVLPKWPPTYQMNLSTIIQPCNETGYFNQYSLTQLAKFGIVSIDWSNAKQLWANAAPMDCQERLLQQVKEIKAINPNTKTWVYRNLVKALPWFTDIRAKITDPAYSDWFLKYKQNGPYNVPPCTNESSNHGGIKCSMLYHDQSQTPHYPGQCKEECDCGTGFPCGEYLYDHRNESLRNWLTNTFILASANNSGLNNPNIDGFFIDDGWSDHQTTIQPWMPKNGFCDTYNTFGGPSEEDYKCAQDMGLTANDTSEITAAWHQSMTMAQNAIISNNGFNWQLMAHVSSPNKTECTDWMKSHGTKFNDSALQYTYTTTFNMTQNDFEIDLAIFLLIRGAYGWLGYGWNGCHSTWMYQWFDLLDKDYGEPLGQIMEINTGVFQRKYSKATIQMDCNQYKPTITFN